MEHTLLSKGGLLEVLHQLARPMAPGPVPSFSHLHVCKVLLTIGNEKLTGRKKLTAKMNLGEGAVRTLVKRLRDARMVSVSKQGCALSRKGMQTFRLLNKKVPKIVEVDAGPFSLDKFSRAILVRDAANLVKMGLEQRDAAITAGATGAVTLVFRNGNYRIPMGKESQMLNSKGAIAKEMDRALRPSENDVIIIVSARSSQQAEYGGLSAALTLFA